MIHLRRRSFLGRLRRFPGLAWSHYRILATHVPRTRAARVALALAWGAVRP